jgi:CubicO group peptidase (beta-lactamase class C family)
MEKHKENLMKKKKSIWAKLILLSIVLLLILLFVKQILIAEAITVQKEQSSNQALNQQSLSFPQSETEKAIISDLKTFIPGRMQEAHIPGLAVALISNNRIIWTEGFGIANSISKKPVTPDTVFEVGSNSKVITAYIALRLVEQGKLALDKPINSYLSKPWLPPSEYRDKITLRHLASHSSGLPDISFPTKKNIAFEPGSHFLYSGTGFLYIQETIEQVTGKSLEEAAREIVFEPLGMSSSSFVNNDAINIHLANGHMRYSFPLSSFIIPFFVIFICIILIEVLILRVRTGKWRPTRKIVIGTVFIAALGTTIMVILLAGKPLPNLALLMILSAVLFTILFIGLYFIGRKIINITTSQEQKTRLRWALYILWFLLSAILLLWLSTLITGPVPKMLSPQPSAVGSLRASAADLASFLIELAEPILISEDMAAKMRAPQVEAGDNMSWGLGIGVAHCREENALWQYGQTFGYRSVMVIYPEQGTGVVVLTNSDHGLPIAFDVAQHAVGDSPIQVIKSFLE